MMRRPSNIVPTSHYDLLFLCRNMMQSEREQLLAFFPMDEFDHEAAALMLMNKGGPKFTLLSADGTPLVAGGWESVAEGVCQSWMVGTDAAWKDHWRAVTKASRWLMEAVMAQGIRRLQTNALASRVAACKWYTDGLKMTPEGVWRKFGRQGQDVAVFSRVQGD